MFSTTKRGDLPGTCELVTERSLGQCKDQSLNKFFTGFLESMQYSEQATY